MPRWAPLDERLWSQVDKSGDCWLWTGRTNRGGYGLIGVGGRDVLVHRLVFELLVGEPGGTLDHFVCATPNCVNPAHLEPTTRAENTRRAMARITHCPRGHAYDEENTRVDRRGSRRCRTCHREAERAARRWSDG